MSLIYIGAFVGKMVGEPWRNGTALYYVSHTTDFYPGIFNPDVLFNRMWFLYVATYLSLLVEGLGWLLIWPTCTRKVTFIIILLFHVGIDVSMTMHIFEYLTMVGWCVFLVEPASCTLVSTSEAAKGPEEPSPVPAAGGDSNAAATSKREARTMTISLALRRLLDTVIFLFFLVLFFSDNIPVMDILGLTPDPIKPYVHTFLVTPLGYIYWRTPTKEILQYSGLHAGPWNVFGGFPDNANDSYAAEIRFHSSNGTEVPMVIWNSPDYGGLNGWVKKRHLRNMNYNEYLAEFRAAQIRLCEYLAQRNSQGDHRVSSVRLIQFVQVSLPPPADLDWWQAPARQPMAKVSYHMYTLFADEFQLDYTDTTGRVDYFAQTFPETVTLHVTDPYHRFPDDKPTDEEEDDDYDEDENDESDTVGRDEGKTEIASEYEADRYREETIASKAEPAGDEQLSTEAPQESEESVEDDDGARDTAHETTAEELASTGEQTDDEPIPSETHESDEFDEDDSSVRDTGHETSSAAAATDEL
jgi:hypothetical protein